MSETDRVQTHFSGGAEAPELEHYRPISPLVIMACIAGLASLLAMVHPLLWIVPVVAAILSICAIVRVSSAQSRHSGRSAAVVALCLAALVGSYAPARTLSRDRTIFSEAQAKSDEWLSLVQHGRLQEAHQLSQNPIYRFQGPGSLATHYAAVPSSSSPMEGLESAGQSPVEQMTEFVTLPLVAKMLKFGENSRIEHLRNVELAYENGELKITMRYRVSGVDDGRPESIEFLIRARRHEEEAGLANWYVGDLERVE